MTDIYDHLILSDNMQTSNDSPKKACVIIYLGKNNDGWWKAKDLIKQVVERAIPIFEACFLGCQALFAFDNALSHATFLANALIVKCMNLNLGEK